MGIDIGKVLKHDPVVQLLGGGRRGVGNGNGHVQLNFPMSPGDTVSTIADKLGLPIDSLLEANPGMSANTPLTAGLTVQLPMGSMGNLHGGNWNDAHGPGDNNLPPGQRELPLPPDLPNPMRARIDGIQLGVTLSAGPYAQQVLPLVAAASLNAADASLQAARGQPLAGWPGSTGPGTTGPGTTGPGSAPVGYVPAADRGGTVATALPASSLGAVRADTVVLSFAQVAGVIAQATMDQQHGGESIPPPPPMPWLDGTRPNLLSAPMAWPGGAPQGAPTAGWSVAAPAVDGNEAKVQIMALLMAQLGQAAMGSAGPASVQTPGFIDPQAVAAQAASMRAGRTIDLGAGRSLQFTLVQDRMRRVGAIGDEERAVAGRRAGEAEKSARGPRTEIDESEAGRDRHEQARRRRAAEAAMRRRRRKLSARCRPRRGPRLPLRAPGQGRYPASIDWAEFRGRLPPRYLWGAAPEAPSP